jgi:hypothetical protein
MISIIKAAEKHFQKILVVSLVFYFFKTAFWPLTYLFIVSYFILIAVFIYSFNWELHIKGFIRNYLSPIILCLVILLWSLNKGYFRNEIIQKDLIRLLILLSYFYLLYWNLTFLKKELPILFGFKLIVITTASIAVINLIKLIASSIFPSEILDYLNISQEMALASDYNFFSLFLLLGLVVLNFPHNESFKLGFSKLMTHSINIIVGINIVISGSRRGILAFLILILIYLFNLWVLQKGSYKYIFRRFTVFFGAICIVIGIGVLLYKTTSQDKISNSVLHYGSFFGINDKTKIERFLWKNELQRSIKGSYIISKDFFKRNPGYWIPMEAVGTSLSNVLTPHGKGIKILREEALNTGGVSFFYNGPAIIYYANHTYKISFKIKFLKGDINSFSVGWFIANGDGGKDFSHLLSLVKNISQIGDGWYNSVSYYTFIDNQIGPAGFINSVLRNTEFIVADFELIDLNYSPSLPKFLIELNKDKVKDPLRWINMINQPLASDSNLLINNDFSYGFNYWKYDADSLKTKIVKIDNLNAALIERGSGNGENWSLAYNGRHIFFKKGNLYQIGFKFKPITPDKIPFVVGFGINESHDSVSAKNLKPIVSSLENGWFQVYAKYRFMENYNDIIFPIHYQLNNSRFYIADLTLVNLDQPLNYSSPEKNKNNRVEIKDKNVNNYFYSDREDRYLFSIELWKKNYTWYNKFFGHGFEYLKWYGEKYLKIPGSNDWPHNPFLTVMLYSGIFGLLLYFWLLFNVIRLYIKIRKTFSIAFLCFILTFYFSFFSGSNPFDPPIMGFFMLLPFLINSAQETDSQNIVEKNNR